MEEERTSALKNILGSGVLAILRVNNSKHLPYIVDALLSGGIRNMEISLNTPDALDMLVKLKQDYSKDINLGIGTVTTIKQALSSVDSGAEFLVSPICDEDIISAAKRANVPIFAGAFSPTEIFKAHKFGADVIKVFPADVLGINYLKSIKKPFPDIPLMPSGGVNIDNIELWFKAGASVVALGSALYDEHQLQEKEFDKISYNARILSDKAADFINLKYSKNYMS